VKLTDKNFKWVAIAFVCLAALFGFVVATSNFNLTNCAARAIRHFSSFNTWKGVINLFDMMI
jgi:hypothetical protein